MALSSQFNRKYHAVLNEIISHRKEIVFDQDGLHYVITLETATTAGLKYLLKFIDEDYPKSKDGKIRLDLSAGIAGLLTKKYGYPISTTNIDTAVMVNHMKWIETFASKNGIYIQDPEWDLLYKLGDQYNG